MTPLQQYKCKKAYVLFSKTRNDSFHISIFKLSSAQDAGTKYTFKQVGWTIILPADFKVPDFATDAAKSARGRKAIEEANEIEADASATRTLIAVTKMDITILIRPSLPSRQKKMAIIILLKKV